MRPNLIPLAVLLLAACATPQEASRDGTKPSTSVEVAPSPAAPRVDAAVSNANLNPTRYASGFPRAEFCEEEARRLRRMAPDTGWALLRACVAQGRFTLLSRLIGGAWDKDLHPRWTRSSSRAASSWCWPGSTACAASPARIRRTRAGWRW